MSIFRVFKYLGLCSVIITFSIFSFACTRAANTTIAMTSQAVCNLVNRKLNESVSHVPINQNERWDMSYQTLSARKPTGQELADNTNLRADDWLLDVKVTMIHEYFQSGMWVTPPSDRVNYQLSHYTYNATLNLLQELP
jgi:hypothetical protein